MEKFYRNRERGITIIEVIVVVAIVGILVTIGGNHFQVAQAQRELNRAASELISDIRLMQQFSANDDRFIGNQSPYYKLTLWNDGQLPANNIISNGYQLLYVDPAKNTTTVVKKNTVPYELNFSNYHVSAQIVNPDSATSVDITYFAYDIDRTKIDGTLENRSYQVKLTHTVTKAVIYVNVDSRVGRVWTNTDGASPI